MRVTHICHTCTYILLCLVPGLLDSSVSIIIVAVQRSLEAFLSYLSNVLVVDKASDGAGDLTYQYHHHQYGEL